MSFSDMFKNNVLTDVMQIVMNCCSSISKYLSCSCCQVFILISSTLISHHGYSSRYVNHTSVK